MFGTTGQQDTGTFDKDLAPPGRQDQRTQDDGTTGLTTDGTYRTNRTKDNRTQDNQDIGPSYKPSYTYVCTLSCRPEGV